jgi:hypothetical protein
MRNSSSYRLGIVLGLAAALTLAAATLSIASAHSPDSDSPAAPRGVSSATGIRPELCFVHVATAGNSNGDSTWLQHPFIWYYDSDAIVLVTPRIGPYGGPDIYNAHHVAVSYASDVVWTALNQDEAPMPVGAGFNVLMPNPDSAHFSHEATPTNTVLGSTRINHALANGNPDAILLVTQLAGTPDIPAVLNDHTIAVSYDELSERWAISNQDSTGIPQGALFNVLIVNPGSEAFVHQTSPANIYNHATYIDHPLANNNPHAIPFVTQNQTPGEGSPGTINDHEVAVLYVEATGQWAIVNQDGANMPPGAAFNVVIPDPDPRFLVHEATAANTLFHSTYWSHDLTDEVLLALLFTTSNWNPGGSLPGVYNDHPIAMRYSGAQWGIRNQDLEAIAEGADLNVLIPGADAGALLHWAIWENTDGSSTYIDHAATNVQADTLLFVTPNFSPGGNDTGNYNDHPIGVWYNSGEGKWAIFNQDYAEMPEEVAFNVLARSSGPNAFVHYASALNIVGNWTTIDHPLANDKPGAVLLVTQNYNPGGVGGVRNAHEIGVWYGSSSGRWAIFNQDMEPMPPGAAFNVRVMDPYRVYLPLVLRSY